MNADQSLFAIDDQLRNRLRSLAHYILNERERRYWFLPRGMFDETPWQMLLLLYVSETQKLPLATLADSLMITPECASRWINYLDLESLVTRYDDPSARSKTVVELAPKGQRSLEMYLADRLARFESQSQRKMDPHSTRRSQLIVIFLIGIAAALAAWVTCLVVFR